MNLKETVRQLTAENARLQADLTAALAQIAALQARLAALEQQKPPPPPGVQANTPPPATPPAPRRKRAAAANRARRRDVPTQFEQHALAACPDCHYPLRGQQIAHTRQVLDLPPPAAVVVTEHQFLRRWCPHCRQWCVPPSALPQHVVGQGRIGVRLASLILYLHSALRLPIRAIQAYLWTLHQCQLSTGGLVELLHRLRAATAPTVATFRTAARASPHVHMDETGWRENGQNGYIWEVATGGDAAVRYYEYDRSRAGAVAQRMLRGFRGVLVSDFYGGYNAYTGRHQRCWVHLLRDLHTLKETHAAAPTVLAWAGAVRRTYDVARRVLAAVPELPPAQREQLAVRLETRVHELGHQYAQVKEHPCQALAKRLLRHEGELFQFVRVAGVPADNNLAERGVRGLVVARKISGGSRGDAGTATRMALASLVGTWQARGLNPFEECLALLRQTPAPQV